MQLYNKNILLISPESWSHLFVSKHHYAIHLGARGNRVYFLNPPADRTSVTETGYKNIWQVNYKGFPKGLRFYPAMLQRFLIRKKFEALQELCGVKFDLVWSFDNSVFYDFSALPDKVIKISHIVDLNQDFQTTKVASTADFCFGTSQFIINSLLKYNKNVWYISHGHSIIKNKEEVNIPYLGNELKVGYAGNLNIKYIDWDLVKDIIERNSKIHFYFAGYLNSPTIKKLFNYYKNVSYIGKLNKDDLGSFYKKMDLLILVYKANQYKEQLANPHKMMEYLASGKMIVATQTQEYKKLVKDGLFLMSKENKEYPQLFESAIQNLPYWNSLEKQQLRREFALENTYDKQIDKIEKLLSPLLKNKDAASGKNK